MGRSSSKAEPKVDNTGVLNGNVINNGNIIEAIESDLSSETLLLKIIIVLKAIHILIILAKWLVKFIRQRENRNQKIDRMILEANKNP